ncbi:VPLPA-CTERM sorting domain-containing protein, partial [Paracoccus sp. (in: a-proteobacteria)]
GMGFEYIKLVDATLNEFGRSGTTSFDGFDVDSVSVAPVPLPAAGLMLLAGLGGFGVMRRRQKKA